MKAMRIVVLAASHFGLRCLRTVRAAAGCEVVGVVTAPRTFAISYRPQGVTNVLHADVAGDCQEAGLPCAELGADAMKDPALFATVKAWRPDAFVVAGWYHIVPRAWRELAPAYGLHGSLLPHYRGGAPLVWAILRGERETGITLFQFDDGVDTGPILAQGRTPIAKSDTIATVYSRIETIGEQLLRDTLPRLAAGTAVAQPQDPAQGSSFPQRGPEDGLIDFGWGADRIHDFIRAQTQPYPGAFFLHAGRKVVVWSAEPVPSAAPPGPGKVRREGRQVMVGTGDGGALRLGRVSVDGEEGEAAAFADWS